MGASEKRKDYISWDEYFMGIAMLSGMRSKDPNTQVGACIVDPEHKILSMGYNGFPLGCSDDEFTWAREGEDNKYFYSTHSELNAILNQRSQDMIAASAWNTCQYAFLVLILCHIFSYEPGEFVHVIGDCHIYDRHIELAKEIIANRSFDAPKVTFDPDVHNFYQVTKNSFTLENYLYSDFSKVIPIAI